MKFAYRSGSRVFVVLCALFAVCAAWLVTVGAMWLTTGPTVKVRWVSGIADESRSTAERELFLVLHGLMTPASEDIATEDDRTPRTESYFLTDANTPNVERIVLHPLIEDTAGINRGTFALEPKSLRMWLDDRITTLRFPALLYLSVFGCLFSGAELRLGLIRRFLVWSLLDPGVVLTDEGVAMFQLRPFVNIHTRAIATFNSLPGSTRLFLVIGGTLIGALPVTAVIAALIYVTGEVGETWEWRLFVLGWVASPIAALGGIVAMLSLMQKRLLNSAIKYGSGALTTWLVSAGILSVFTIGIPVFMSQSQIWRDASAAGIMWSNLSMVVVITLILTPCMLGFRYFKFHRWAAIATVAVLATYIIKPAFEFGNDPHHHSFYLGPVNAVLQGRAMLVDVVSQYGVGSIYAIAAFFTFGPSNVATFEGLAALTMLAQFAMYAIAFVVFGKIVKSWLAAVVFISAVILMNDVAPLGLSSHVPSTGGLRFGLPYLLFAISQCGDRLPIRLLRGLKLLVVAGSSLWSFETFIYTAMTFGVMSAFETVCETDKVRAQIMGFAKTLGLAMLCILIAHGGFAVLTRTIAGQWPDWSLYFNFITLYSVGADGMGADYVNVGYGTMLIEMFTGWEVVSLVYLASMVACVAVALSRPGKAGAAEYVVVAGMTALGIAQFTYFLGRSHPNNLLHVMIPALFVGLYWTFKVIGHASINRYTKVSLSVGVGVLVALTFLSTTENLEKNLNASLLVGGIKGLAGSEVRPARWSCVFHTCPHFGEAGAEAIKLIEALSPPGSSVGVLLRGKGRSTEVLIEAGRKHLYPVSTFEQDILAPENVQRIVDTEIQPSSQAGDLLIVDNQFVGIVPDKPSDARIASLGIRRSDEIGLEEWMFTSLCSQFDCRLERRGVHVSALRLVVRDDPSVGTIIYEDVPTRSH